MFMFKTKKPKYNNPKPNKYDIMYKNHTIKIDGTSYCILNSKDEVIGKYIKVNNINRSDIDRAMAIIDAEIAYDYII